MNIKPRVMRLIISRHRLFERCFKELNNNEPMSFYLDNSILTN